MVNPVNDEPKKKDTKIAKKNKHRKHDTDDSYGNPKGGKNIQNLPTSKIKA